MSELTPFSLLNEINNGKTDIMVDAETEKAYVPFLTNRGLSFFIDTIYYANEMNRNCHLDKKLQFHYLLNIVRKGKRFRKWDKKTSNDDLKAIQEFYGFSIKKAESALSILTEAQIKYIKSQQVEGGK